MVDSAPHGAAAGEPPLLSVCIPTRGRAEHITACVESILACTGPTFEVIVVDQSDGLATRLALTKFAADPRFSYVPSATRGNCAGRNVGIERSRGALFVCTDDDCRVPPDWLANYAATFAREPDTALICGRVTVPEELLAGGGFAASFKARFAESNFDTLADRDCGICANMAFRRSTVERAGPFDALLGSGSPLGSGGEPDFLFRVLRAGLRARNEPSVVVSHLGVRRGDDIDPLWKRYFFGTGAALFKHVRLLDPQGIRVFSRYVGYFGKGTAVNLVRGRRPLGAGTVIALLKGAAASLRFEVDAKTRLFRERGA